jgi:Phage integrase family
LNWLNEHRYGDYLFMWPWGDRVGRTTVYDAFKETCNTAKITDFRFHDLRHTFASHLVMAAVDLVTVKDLLGHTGINMTVRYSHLVPEHKAQAVAKLEERFKGSVEETQAQNAVVSPELKEAIGDVLTRWFSVSKHKLQRFFDKKAPNDNMIKQKLEAASGFEPLHRGFADLSLNHLGTPP